MRVATCAPTVLTFTHYEGISLRLQVIRHLINNLEIYKWIDV